MQVRVDDKVLLVTGAAQGLGRAVALEAARSGASAIILTDRNTKGREEVVPEILVRLNNWWVKMTGFLVRYEAGSQVFLRVTNFKSLRQVASYAI